MKAKKLVALYIILTIIICSIGTVHAEKETKYYLTKIMDRIKTTHDQGFYWAEDIDSGDPHYNWGLGRFYIKGYTSMLIDKDNVPVFLKNVGDELEVGFELATDIDAINGKNNVIINEDKNGRDDYFETDQQNFGRGCLIVQETDYQNTPHIAKYVDYLTVVKRGTANTKVKPFGEGDYIIKLDYELKFPRFPGSGYNDYTILSEFKIRNSNCMVFLYNIGENQDEITNGAVAENGFRLDYKNSYFLNVTITKQILVENDGIYTLDTRSCKSAADGREYTEEGLYTIVVSNQYTEQTITKQVSVGQNKVLNVYAAHSGTINPNEIAKKIGEGVQINKDWKMVMPEASAENSTNQRQSDYSGFQPVNSNSSTESDTNSIIIIAIIGTLILIALAIFLITKANKRKEKNVNSAENKQPDAEEIKKLDDGDSKNKGNTENTEQNPSNTDETISPDSKPTDSDSAPSDEEGKE